MVSILDKMPGMTYRGIKEIRGPLLVIEGVDGVAYDEIARIYSSDGVERFGRVLEVGRGTAVLQIFGSEMGLQSDTVINFQDSTFRIPVSDAALGRIVNGICEPLDGAPPITSSDMRDVNGLSINPVSRVYPNNFIQTGISVIDVMLSIVRGQKLPIFSESGIPHNRLIAQISRQATTKEGEDLVFIFAAMGLKHDEAQFFIEQFRESGALERSVIVLNLADDPPIERILTPRIALTLAEYIAFDCEFHVLTVLSNMTNYAEALRGISSAKGEVPSRKGYPGYLYSDLASIYERAGIIRGRSGSLTQMPILTMPGGDLHHPIPDQTGYITEGQLFLDRDLHMRGIYPPINVLPSLSRLMRKGIGKGKTREDHKDVSDQLYDAYSRGVRARDLSRIVGEIGLSEAERRYLQFADAFEKKFVNQGDNENRDIERSLDLSWEVLSLLSRSELTRISEDLIERYHVEKTNNIRD